MVIFPTPDGLLDLSSVFESNQTGEASSPGVRIIYDSALGTVSYDEYGNDLAVAAIPFATLTGAPPLAAADFLIWHT